MARELQLGALILRALHSRRSQPHRILSILGVLAFPALRLQRFCRWKSRGNIHQFYDRCTRMGKGAHIIAIKIVEKRARQTCTVSRRLARTRISLLECLPRLSTGPRNG